VPDCPALLLRPRRRGGVPWLVIADLHLGLGDSPGPVGVPAGTSARRMAEELVALARSVRVRHLLVAGDVKHPIVGTPRPLRPVVFDFFSHLLAEGLHVAVVPGNHDVGLAPALPSEVRLHPPEGTVVEGVGICHGHRWPSDPVLRAERIVFGHLHPGVRLAPSAERPTGKERCWVRVTVRPDGLRRPTGRAAAARELVVLPAFNALAGTEALNRERPRRGRSFLYRRFLTRGPARAYLLDGTDVGVLPMPRPTRPTRAAPAAPRGR
jgi:uncharacterized protein